MSDLNKEALDVWGGLKPIIDQEISSRTQGMVQRRKAKVTTAPSLATNTIGVTEAFGDEMFLPFVSNMISAKVGDFVWIEWMYGATNAFVSSFAAVDDKNITVAGVLDVVPRRCLKTLTSAGWYRIMTFNGTSANDANGYAGSQIDFTITRDNGANRPENHSISFHLVADVIKFDNERSTSNALCIDKIRYCRNGSHGYVDIHYLYSTQNNVSVYFTVFEHYSRQYRYVATNLEAAADSPSGEIIITTYDLHANGDYTNTDLTVGGVLDVVPRRCYAPLSSEGWYRVMVFDGSSSWVSGAIAFTVDITLFDWARQATRITLWGVSGSLKFDHEQSVSYAQLFDKIRYMQKDGYGYIDVHYTAVWSGSRYAACHFDVKQTHNATYTPAEFESWWTAINFTPVDPSPSRETQLALYTFAANTDVAITAWSLTITGTANVSMDKLYCRYSIKNGVLYIGGRFNITSFTSGVTDAEITLPVNLGADRGHTTIGTMFSTTKTLQLLWNGSGAYITDAVGNYSGRLLNTGYWSFQIVAPIYN